MNKFDSSFDLTQILPAMSALGVPAFVSDADYVRGVFRTVLGRSQVDPATLDFWTMALRLPEGSEGAQSRETLALSILYSGHALPVEPMARLGYDTVADSLFASEHSLFDAAMIERGAPVMQEAAHGTAIALVGMSDADFAII